jgi:hypothetical protein
MSRVLSGRQEFVLHNIEVAYVTLVKSFVSFRNYDVYLA